MHFRSKVCSISCRLVYICTDVGFVYGRDTRHIRLLIKRGIASCLRQQRMSWDLRENACRFDREFARISGSIHCWCSHIHNFYIHTYIHTYMTFVKCMLIPCSIIYAPANFLSCDKHSYLYTYVCMCSMITCILTNVARVTALHARFDVIYVYICMYVYIYIYIRPLHWIVERGGLAGARYLLDKGAGTQRHVCASWCKWMDSVPNKFMNRFSN